MTTWAELQAARAASWQAEIGRPAVNEEDAIARVVLAVASGARTFREVEARTFREVEARTGIQLTTAFKYARIARRRGLIDWDASHAATLRTDLTIVAHTPACPCDDAHPWDCTRHHP